MDYRHKKICEWVGGTIVAVLCMSRCCQRVAAFEGKQDISPEFIAKSVLNGRKAIRSGDFELTSKYRSGSRAVERKTQLRFDYDKQFARIDYSIAGGPVVVKCYGCERADAYVSHSTERMPDGGRYAVQVKPARRANGNQEQVIDPRVLGLVTSDSANSFRWAIDSFVGKYNASECEVSSVVEDGRDCVLIVEKGRPPNNAVVSSWFHPNQGYSLVRMDVDYGKDAVDSIHSTIRYFDEYKIWFPSHIEFESKRNGDVVRGESLDIVVNSLNKPCEEFASLTSFPGLDSGTLVVWHEDEKFAPPTRSSLIWDGRAITSGVPSGVVLPEAPRHTLGRVFIVALNVVVTVCVAIWWFIRRRSRHVPVTSEVDSDTK